MRVCFGSTQSRRCRWGGSESACRYGCRGVGGGGGLRGPAAPTGPPQSERLPEGPPAPVVAAVLTTISLPLIARVSRGDARLFWTLVAAEELRLLASVVHLRVSKTLYGHQSSDADDYHRAGVELAERFRAGNFDVRLGSPTGMGAIRLVTGVVHTIVGRSRLNGYLVFSWLGFWGIVFFYNAFVTALPEGDAMAYLLLLALLPSLVYFPAAISKEAWILFALGLATLGATRLATEPDGTGVALAVLGLGLAGATRPHTAAMLAASLLLGSAAELRGRRLVAATAGVAVLTAWTLRFLQNWGLGGKGSLAKVWLEAASRTNYGRSRFSPPYPGGLRALPRVAGSVLFRPHPFEANTPITRGAAVESAFLVLFMAARLRSALAAACAREPYVVASARLHRPLRGGLLVHLEPERARTAAHAAPAVRRRPARRGG